MKKARPNIKIKQKRNKLETKRKKEFKKRKHLMRLGIGI
jgi:hypothetical protein